MTHSQTPESGAHHNHTDNILIAANIKRDHFELRVIDTLPANGITMLYGPSGAGKTSLLRILAGLDKAKHLLTLCGEPIHLIPPHRRPLGYVQQRPYLFPHMNVARNLDYAEKRQLQGDGIPREEVIELLKLGDLLERPSQHLSGGERQRVAIAQALLRNPKMLLLDEPLSSLDQQQQRNVMNHLERLKQHVNIPMLYVTHALHEVARLGDHLLVMDNGKVVQRGPLPQAFKQLQEHVDESIISCIIEGNLGEKDPRWGLTEFVFEGGQFLLHETHERTSQTARVQLFAKDVSLAKTKHTDMSLLNILPGTVTAIDQSREAVALVEVTLHHSSHCLIASITQRSVHEMNLAVGDDIWAQIKSVALIS